MARRTPRDYCVCSFSVDTGKGFIMSTSILAWGLVPPILLIIYMYHLDKIEREPVGLIIKTFIFGMLSVIPAILWEIIGEYIVLFILPDSLVYRTDMSDYSVIYYFLEMFFVVAIAEETSKRALATLSVWKNPEFNFRFDAVIYYTTSALGFAAAENILYMTDYGSEIAISRLIPVHSICGVFMGYHMGLAKTAELDGDLKAARRHKRHGLIIPVLIHGSYDFCLSVGSDLLCLAVLLFILVLTIVAWLSLRRYARQDMPV